MLRPMVRIGTLRAPFALLALVILVALVALPALAASPFGPGGAAGRADKPGNGPKASTEPGVDVTLRGSVATTTDADGNTTYTLTANGKTVRLEAGPSWFFADQHPLASSVGKTVTIVGRQHGDEVDVESVDGVALREGGKPAWAGGWKAVGSAHPGWSQEKWDRWQQRVTGSGDKTNRGNGVKPGAAGCWPPGQCREKTPKGDEPAGTPDPNGG
jgi:hypothetical protein